MKACKACRVQVETENQFCPLCGEGLDTAAAVPAMAADNRYPNLSRRAAQYHFLSRLLLFLTLFGCGISLLLNFLLTPAFWWSLIVLAAAVYCWLTIPPLLRRGRNFGARAFFTSTLTCILVVALDGIIGWNGWSVSYVVPSLLTAGIASIAMLMVFNRTNHAQYVLYQVMLGVLGFAPLVLYILDISQNLVLVIITASVALASLLGTFVFGDRTIKNEFKRRFHF